MSQNLPVLYSPPTIPPPNLSPPKTMATPTIGAMIGKAALETLVGGAVSLGLSSVVSLWNRKKSKEEMLDFDAEPEPLPTKRDLQPYCEPTPEDTVVRPYINPTQIIDYRPDILCERYGVPRGTNIYKYPYKWQKPPRRYRHGWRR